MDDLPDGLYESLIDDELAARLDKALGARQARDLPLDTADASEDRLRLLTNLMQDELTRTLDQRGSKTSAQVNLILELLQRLRQPGQAMRRPLQPLRMLAAVHDAGETAPEHPRTGLGQTWLFTAGRHDPSLLGELRRELGSVDRVDMVVSFITWSSVRKIMDLLDRATATDASGVPRTRIRILTTTYTGATEARAVEWLAERPGVEVRISLDGRRTRLHAKAWIFRRKTGFGTAYVGSANLSGAAMTGGLEWTLKITQAGSPAVFEAAAAQFETLWNDPEFTRYNPREESQRQSLRRALAREKGDTRAGGEDEAGTVLFHIEPKTYQHALLEQLWAERRHGRTRNLLVAVTGTGKTVVAAFDYLRSCTKLGGRPRLLFIAHRQEILQQARTTFIQVLRQPGFGAVCGGGWEPENFDHVFCTVQSFSSRGLRKLFGHDYWHTVIVDECHHMAAPSYAALAELKPAIMLGLTATPERADGQRLAEFFQMRLDGAPAAELRLWQALDQQLLAPFEYYGCEDDTDLSEVPWDSRQAELDALDKLISANHARARATVDALQRFAGDTSRIRCLAFCVSVGHAKFMAEAFLRHGIRAEVVVGDPGVTPPEQRRNARQRLAAGQVNVLCTCDLFNEGIDIPTVDTLLFLRPTQSPVVIQQQLGRGLRLAPGKESCLIIDLVGRHRREFRFDRLLGMLSGLSRKRLENAVQHGFSSLPPGCHIHLDRLPREQVLRNLHQVAITSWPHLARELRVYASLGGGRNADLATFIHDTGVELADLYRGNGPRGWTALRRKAGLETRPVGVFENAIASKLRNLLPQDDPELLQTLRRVAETPAGYPVPSKPMQARMDALSAELFPAPNDPCPGVGIGVRLDDAAALREELVQLAELLEDGNPRQPRPLPGMPGDWPFQLHCGYSLRSICMYSGKVKPDSRHLPREGLIRFAERKIELLLVTLDKSTGFKASTRYHSWVSSQTSPSWRPHRSRSRVC